MTLLVLLLILGVLLMFFFFERYRKERRGKGISIIIPFRCVDRHSRRYENFKWVMSYWRKQLPGAEVIQGKDPNKKLPFSKSCAVNNGVAKSTGDILVIVDADGYIPIHSILTCAKRMRRARERGHRLWFIPYRRFYRLTDGASKKVLRSDPCDPYTFPTPPKSCDIQDVSGSNHGHWFGAMIQIWPREAFDEVGGWDKRFRGWGGEDHAAMRACDTLYWPHKTLPGQALHLWHPMLSLSGTDSWVHWDRRVWENQKDSGSNDQLNARYYGANGDYKRMRKLVDEGKQ